MKIDFRGMTEGLNNTKRSLTKMRFTLIKQNLLKYTCKILLIQLKDRFTIDIDFYGGKIW